MVRTSTKLLEEKLAAAKEKYDAKKYEYDKQCIPSVNSLY